MFQLTERKKKVIYERERKKTYLVSAKDPPLLGGLYAFTTGDGGESLPWSVRMSDGF